MPVPGPRATPRRTDMKTNRFAATAAPLVAARNERRSPSFRVLGGFACAMISALVATASASAAASRRPRVRPPPRHCKRWRGSRSS